MIFYFTGTGNSLHAARKLLYKGEQLVDMAKALEDGALSYQLSEGERVGFVYPEYCGTFGATVREFVSKLELQGFRYVFALITCAGKGVSGGELRKLLESRGIPLHYADFVVMPSNCVTFFDVPGEEKAAEILQKAEAYLAELREELRSHPVDPPKQSLHTAMIAKTYVFANGTKKYFADDRCIGCGLCAKNCPSHAIEMQNGGPVWVKPHCDLCCGCINRCPVQAIQYGKGTKNRRRYVHPDLKK